MKYLAFTLLFLTVISAAFSQSTTITPGTVLPRMTTAQRLGLINPIEGTMVFDTETRDYWLRYNGAWYELPKFVLWESTSGGAKTVNGGFWSENPTGLTIFSTDITNPPTAPKSGDGTRLMWIPSRSAFRAGTVSDGSKAWDRDSIGLFSFATGLNNKATAAHTTALGVSTTASGLYSTALGAFTIASGLYSTAMGQSTQARNLNAIAMGLLSVASGGTSTAIGNRATASGAVSFSIGNYTTASGGYSTAMGTRATTNGKQGSFVIGDFIGPNEGEGGDTLVADISDRFLARFDNGYTLYTESDLSNATKYGVFMTNKSNSWSSISDSTKKENFIPASGEKILNSVAAMRVGTWNYKGDTERQNNRHWGVMAQDFYHYFGKDPFGTVGCDTLIATADFDGVSFAAIKALEERTQKLQKENEALNRILEERTRQLQAANEKLQKEIDALKAVESRIAKLEALLRIEQPREDKAEK
ncbi:MAG: tail fiber domain-containing protein [Spirosomataceae bacterium]